MEKNLCVLIDFENIAAGTEKDGLGRFDVNLVLERLADKGRVLIARSYADWGRFARFKQQLLTANVSMMELTSHGMQDKNRADIALVVEGMELAFTKPYIDTFVVVSGDSDFTPMVLKMRELDKRVIGCGCRSSTSRLLIQACDEFIFYDNLAKRKKTRTAKKESRRSKGGEPSLEDAFELLNDTLEGLQRENPDPPHASVVKSAMLRKSPDFNEGDLGFSSLARFLERARKAGIVALIRDEKSGGYRVDQPNGSADEGGGSSGGGGSKRSEGTWLDPYLPDGASKYVEVLSAEGLNPLAAPTRKSVLQCLEEVVEQRDKRKRRNTVHFVQDDVTKRMRKTHPDLPAKGIRNVFNGLMRANAFIHRDGNPVRTGSAPFSLEKTAEELNETLTDIYVYELIGNGMDLDVKVLAELFLGDASRTRPIEESLAYHQANAQEDDGDGDGDDDGADAPDLDEVDVDSLLLEETDDDGDDEPKKPSSRKKSSSRKTSASKKDEDDDEASTSKKSTAKKSTAKKSTAKKSTAKKSTAKKDDEGSGDDDGTDDDAEDSKAASTRKKTTARKTTASKSTAKDDDGDTDDGDTDDGESAEAKPKKPTRRRTRKKKSDVKADKAAASDDDDLDSLLSED